MGGHLTLTIRRTTGEIESVGVWTNFVKTKLQTQEFLAEGDTHELEEFMKFYREDEHSKGIFGGTMRHIPGEYGMIFVDCIEHKVYDWNSYTTVSRLSNFDLGCFDNDKFSKEWVDWRDEIRPFLKTGDYYDKNILNFVPFTVPEFETDEAFMEFATTGFADITQDRVPMVHFLVVSPVWTYETLHHNNDSHQLKMFMVFEELGVLNAEDHKAWLEPEE